MQEREWSFHSLRFKITSRSNAIKAPAATALATANPATAPSPKLVFVTVLVGTGAVDVRDVGVPAVRFGEGCDAVAGVVTVVPAAVTVVVLGARADCGTNNVAPDGKTVVDVVVVLGEGAGSVNVNTVFAAKVTLTAAIFSFAVENQ